MKSLLAFIACLLCLPAFGQYGSGQGSYGTIGVNSNTILANQPRNTYYVSTLGSDITGKPNLTNSPYGPNLSAPTSVNNRVATNPGDTIFLLQGDYWPTGTVYVANGVTLRGWSRDTTIIHQTNSLGSEFPSFFQPHDNCILSHISPIALTLIILPHSWVQIPARHTATPMCSSTTHTMCVVLTGTLGREEILLLHPLKPMYSQCRTQHLPGAVGIIWCLILAMVTLLLSTMILLLASVRILAG